MTKTRKSLFSVWLIIAGILLNGFAWSTTIGHPISTMSLGLGLMFLLGGLIWLIILSKS